MNGGQEARTAAYTGVRQEIVDLVALDRRQVLDVGCADGSLGAALKRRQTVSVLGLEGKSEYAETARSRIDSVLQVHLDDLTAVQAALAGEQFDCIIVADVLEHLRNPWGLIATISSYLVPGGHMVLSVPNVGHVDTLWNVFVRGTWPRRPRGLHDETHLQWFAERDLPRLLEAGGLQHVEMRRTYRFVDRPTPRNDAAGRFAVAGLRRLLTYQFVMLARKL